MKIFCLDDELISSGYEQRDQLPKVLAGHDLTLALTLEEAKEKFKPPYDLMLLDFDLNGNFGPVDNPNTGLSFIKWMVGIKQPAPLPQTILHSVSQKGRKAMHDLLDEYGYHVLEYPFSQKYIDFLKASFSLERTA